MRLQIAERPERNHLRKARDVGPRFHDFGRRVRSDDEDIEREGIGGRRREDTGGSCEIECAEWLMHVHRGAGRADEPLNRHTTAMRLQPIAALSAAHVVGRAAPIELRSAFAEAEHGRVAKLEAEHTVRGVDLDRLELHGLGRRAGD